jgi:toxin ParE1/3/4
VRTYRIAGLAEWDLKAIARQTLKAWGEAQSKRTIQTLLDCFQLAAEEPDLGRPCDFILPGLRRIQNNHHVSFYVPEGDGVRIARVLSEQMLPTELKG